MSLRFRINLLITILTVVLSAALFKVVIDDVRRSIREEMEGANKVTLQLLSTAVRNVEFMSKSEDAHEMLSAFLRNLGRVRAHDIKYIDANDKVLYESPPSIYKSGHSAPEWFTRMVRPQTPVMNLPVHGGHIVVTMDASRSIVDAWDDLQDLILILVAFLVAINVLVFFLIGRSLRPVNTVLEGLKRMERGDYSTRLPSFSLPEFNAISHTFNGMASGLEESHAENRRLALITEQSSDAILIHDLEGRISYWNPAAQRLFGYKDSEIVGKSAMLITPPERSHELKQHSDVVRARRHVENVETQRLARDGRCIDVALSAAPLVDPVSDNVIGEICAMRDITELKHARETEAELAQNRKLTQLIQGHLEEERRTIARELHDELGQCVTAIKTIGTVIARDAEASSPETHRSAKTIVSVAEHIYDVVHGMIRQLRPSSLDHLGLRETIVEAVAQWRKLHPAIECKLELQGDVEGLGERINITAYRIVQECLTNIVKHAQASEVNIALSRDKHEGAHQLRITVSDNGRGINGAPGVAEQARFGLMGMRERAEALGGRFEVVSHPASGTTISAYLPLSAKDTMLDPEKTAQHS